MAEQIPFTKEGYEELGAELERLKNVERPKVIAEIAEARAHGDLKENAEYHAAREKQSYIEGRINLLDDALARANVIAAANANPDMVQFGTWTTVEDLDSEEVKTFRIVGDLEANIEKNLISMKSPLARALLGKRIDDEVTFKAPKGEVCYLIRDVAFAGKSE